MIMIVRASIHMRKEMEQDERESRRRFEREERMKRRIGGRL
jgi:hypothetical protein